MPNTLIDRLDLETVAADSGLESAATALRVYSFSQLIFPRCLSRRRDSAAIGPPLDQA